MTGQARIAVSGRHVMQNKTNPVRPGRLGLRIEKRMSDSSKQDAPDKSPGQPA